ncbi:Rv3235 family protein [Actinoplanes sp. NBC_00393]|uniref:Rv3235 family protein n=1 Tax=Actinoplanes sp. NBC_00393 TaxID=2975953 RepID=UPI002E1E457A
MRSVEMASTGHRPAIRLRPVPRYEPPFDDELAPQVWASARQLPLDWSAQEVPPVPSDGPRALPGPRTDPAPPVVAGASSDAKLAVRRFVHLCVEVLNGYRPPAHLRRLALPAEAASVVAEGLAGARRVAALRAAKKVGARPPRRPVPVAVLRLRLCEPRPGAVEAAVALVTGERTWAMALRMELHQKSWAATALRLI